MAIKNLQERTGETVISHCLLFKARWRAWPFLGIIQGIAQNQLLVFSFANLQLLTCTVVLICWLPWGPILVSKYSQEVLPCSLIWGLFISQLHFSSVNLMSFLALKGRARLWYLNNHNAVRPWKTASLLTLPIYSQDVIGNRVCDNNSLIVLKHQVQSLVKT